VSTAFFRLALAVPVLALLDHRPAAGKRAVRRADAWRLALPGVFFAADLGVWHWSIRLTSVANATLLANFAPVFVTIGGWLVFRRRFRRLFVVGLVLAVAGTVLLVGSSASLGRRGDALGLLTAVFYASYILAIGRLREEFATTTVMLWSAAAAAIVLLPFALLTEADFVPGTGRAWLVLAGLALVSHVAGQGLIAFALAHLPAAFSSVTLLLQPLLATALAWLLFAERPGPLQAAGALLMLTGIYLARRASREKRV
jgi:drug/metabolite transporter (DMT)-like permease